jgi:hypothetical protein
MGQLNVRFFPKGKELGQIPNEENNIKFDKEALMQGLKNKYNIYKMNEIEFEGEDFYIDIDLDNVQAQSIDWEALDYPNDEIKGKVLEIVYYQYINQKLKRISDEIGMCRFEDRHLIYTKGQETIRILNNTKEESNYLPYISTNPKICANRINYTVNQKEVRKLNSMKPSASRKRKQQALNEAIRILQHEIKGFTMFLDDIQVNHKS